MHKRALLKMDKINTDEGRIYFSRNGIPLCILVATIGLYVAGAVTRCLSIDSIDYKTGEVCTKSFNLATLGNALINEISLTDNSAAGETWLLYLVYVTLNFAFPVMTHTMQIFFLSC